jgi:hypothetical protein
MMATTGSAGAPMDYALLDKIIDILQSGDSSTIHSLYTSTEVFHERLRPAAVNPKADRSSVHGDTTDKFFFVLSSNDPRFIPALKAQVDALYTLLLSVLRERRTSQEVLG